MSGRRITGAEARELAARATPGPWERIIRRSVADVIVWAPSAPMEGMGTPIVANCEYRREDAALCAAAPDLAASLAAVEAERDALRAFYEAQMAYDEATGEHAARYDAESYRAECAALTRLDEATAAVEALRGRV